LFYLGPKPSSPADHYKSVLCPVPPDGFISTLPDPADINLHLETLRNHLQRYPTALVGEIGLDKSFRLPNVHGSSPGERTLSPYRVNIGHQRDVMMAQLRIAAEFSRPVSIHAVQVTGTMYDLFQQYLGHPNRKSNNDVVFENSEKSWRHAIPPTVCLHSYSGSVAQIHLWTHKSMPVKLFFSFSSIINGRYMKWADIIRAVPDDRILAETDWHCAGVEMDARMDEVVKYIAWAKEWDLKRTVDRLYQNFLDFIDLKRDF
jgi:Tat protein secretion system quality control protein TatD with DNase activity